MQVAPPSADTRPDIFGAPGPRRFSAAVATPAGEMGLVSDGEALVELRLPAFGPFGDPVSARAPRALRDAADELLGYLAGELHGFSVPLAPIGTRFQLEVWAALCTISYGATASYGEIAQAVGRPRAPRAVGMANHVNPIAIIVPCHRVIGADGSLTGYGGGIDLKSSLLRLEDETLAGRRFDWSTRSKHQLER